MRTKKEKTATKNLSITQFTLVLERMINKLMLNEGKIDKLEVVDDIRYFKSYNPKIINYITKETDDINKEKDNLEEIAKISSTFVLLETKVDFDEFKYSRYNMFILYTSVYIYIYMNKEIITKDNVLETFEYYFNILNEEN